MSRCTFLSSVLSFAPRYRGVLLWVFLGGLVAALFAFPAIDITVSSWFWDPKGEAFIARVWGPAEWVRLTLPKVLGALAAVILGLWVAGEALGRVFLAVSRRVALYLLLSLAIGPGVIVNLILKDYWGRPRPSTILEFGGPHHYVRPMLMSNYCDHNCSFPSGHAALGFWAVSFALLVPPPWRRTALFAAFLAGSIVGFIRIGQGGHFLSDVVFSAIITISVSAWLHGRLLPLPKVTPPKNILPYEGNQP